jgi:GxxExxY protein
LISTDYTDCTDCVAQVRIPTRRFDPAQGRDPRSHAIIGAAMEVHRRLGPGFLEGVYQEALAIEFAAQHLPFQREVELPVYYREQRLSTAYRVDFICHDAIVVELKALARLTGLEESQLINYLRAARFDTGLLLNFGARSLEHRRFTTSGQSDVGDSESA